MQNRGGLSPHPPAPPPRGGGGGGGWGKFLGGRAPPAPLGPPLPPWERGPGGEGSACCARRFGVVSRLSPLCVVGLVLLSGCGLADYEDRMAEAQARVQRFDE